MEEFKNFDENIKNKLSEEEFPFDESNWEKAAKMIDDSRRPKKRYGWIIVASLVFVGTSVLLFNTFKDSGRSLDKEIALSPENKNQDGKTQDEIRKSEENKGRQDAGLKTQGKEGTEGNKETQDSGTKTQEIKGTEGNKGTQDSRNKNQDAVGSNTLGSGNKKENVKTSDISIPKTEKKNKAVKEENTNVVASNNVIKTKATEGKISASVEKKKNETKKPEEKQIATKNNETSKQPNAIEKEKQLTATTDPSVTVTINSKPDSVVKPIEKMVASAPLDSVRKTDSLKTVAETKTEPKKDETKPEPFDKNIISIEAGASYLLGWQNSGSTEGNGLNPVFGVNYSRFFTKNIGVAIGLQYNSVSNFINNTTTKDSTNNLITGGSVSSVTHYDFGVQNDVTIINTTKLHYLVMPVKFQVQLKKNIFGAGCNLAYVFNSDNSVVTYTERNNTSTSPVISKSSGYYLGAYNSLNVQIGAFYRRKLFKGLSVNAEFLYGVSDVKNNTFFKSNASERNIGFKLTLCYDLFKK